MTDELVETATVGSLSLSDSEIQRVVKAAQYSRSHSTARNYAQAVRNWLAWLEDHGIEPGVARPEHVAAWLTTISTRLAPSTVDVYAAGISAWCVDHNRPNLVVDAGVQRVRRGLRRMTADAPVRRVHALTTAEIRRMVVSVDRSTVAGKRDVALILLGFAGAFRRSELSALQVDDVKTRSDGLVVTIRRSKGDQDRRGQHVGIVRGQHPETDPVAAWRDWIKAAGITTGPAFLPVSYTGQPRHGATTGLNGRSIARIVQDAAEKAGLGDLDVSGHSLRAGHVTEAATRGIPADRLARTTRHKNMTTLAIYVRPAQVLNDTTSGLLGL